MGGSSSKGTQDTQPGTLSPITATLLSLFGSNPIVTGQGQFQPTTFGAPGASFTPQSFSALPGLLQNMPPSPTEQAITGGGVQQAGFLSGLQSQGLFQQGAAALPALLETDPKASIAAARRGFEQETVPSILERAPGFSSSDLQRELTRAGTDLETNISALREANLGRVGQVVQGIPAFAQAFGSNLLDQASQALGFGQVGRDFMREQSPSGDAFRVLSMLQALTGPALVSTSEGQQKSKEGHVL